MVLYIIIIYIDIMNLTTIHLSAIINQYYIINHSSFPISPPLQFLRALLLLRELPLGGQVLLRGGSLVLGPQKASFATEKPWEKTWKNVGKMWGKCGENVQNQGKTREKLGKNRKHWKKTWKTLQTTWKTWENQSHTNMQGISGEFIMKLDNLIRKRSMWSFSSKWRFD